MDGEGRAGAHRLDPPINRRVLAALETYATTGNGDVSASPIDPPVSSPRGRVARALHGRACVLYVQAVQPRGRANRREAGKKGPAPRGAANTAHSIRTRPDFPPSSGAIHSGPVNHAAAFGGVSMHRRRLGPSLAVLLALALSAAAVAAVPPEDFSALRWRLVGPLRGGWGTCAAGCRESRRASTSGPPTAGCGRRPTPGAPGAPCSTTRRWPRSAPWRSPPAIPGCSTWGRANRLALGHRRRRRRLPLGDGGKSWELRGLEASRHIGGLWIDPRNADVVVAAAQGHFFGPNPEPASSAPRTAARAGSGSSSSTRTAAPPTSPPIRPRRMSSSPRPGRSATTPGSPTSPPTSDRGAASSSRPTAARPGRA